MEAERSELSLCLNLAKAGRRFSRIMLVVCKYIYRVHIYIYIYVSSSLRQQFETLKNSHTTRESGMEVWRDDAPRDIESHPQSHLLCDSDGVYIYLYTQRRISDWTLKSSSAGSLGGRIVMRSDLFWNVFHLMHSSTHTSRSNKYINTAVDNELISL